MSSVSLIKQLLDDINSYWEFLTWHY
uniref:Uncharacterized protein n=1 Tax=Arundo donax TaxID=35708 RepID=A0A0A9EKD6_ARUDO